ncbi:MAG: response regulator, partial [Pseudomonadota bacterium]
LPVTGYEGPRKTLLAVDDDLNHLALLDRFLSDRGFVVLCASSVQMAEAMLKDALPHIILLDIDMPGRDGWSFAQSLRNGDHASTPIMMVSGHANEERKYRPEFGLHDAFLAKPYNLDDLVLRIAELLKIKLTLDKNTEASKRRPLSSAEHTQLIDLAQIGHASALRSALEELRVSHAGPGPMLRDLQGKLEAFDMPGFIETLEANHDHR